MKKILFALAILCSSCATLLGPPDWEFDCEWARFWDFQQDARNRAMGMPFKSQFSKIYCEGDPSTMEYWGSTKTRKPETPNDTRK